MTLAIMQPYFFPYLGYFQLVGSADQFVFYDDVGFIKQGWVNRNRLLIGGRPHLFTVPVRGAGVSPPINQTEVAVERLPWWRRRFCRLLRESYARAPYREPVLKLVEHVLDSVEEEAIERDIGSLARKSVEACCEYLDLETAFLLSSREFPRTALTGADRVLDICRKAGATRYLNLPGGRDLYDAETFAHGGVHLSFLKPRFDPYPQLARPFVAGLSILDMLMNVDRQKARDAVLNGDLE